MSERTVALQWSLRCEIDEPIERSAAVLDFDSAPSVCRIYRMIEPPLMPIPSFGEFICDIHFKFEIFCTLQLLDWTFPLKRAQEYVHFFIS